MSRVAIYIENKVDYVRRIDLECQDSNLITIDLVGNNKTRIINLYRSFSPQHLVSQRVKFVTQLELIKNFFTSSTIVLGHFNLDWSKRFDVDYSYRNYYDGMDRILGDLELIQTVERPTWTRTVN